MATSSIGVEAGPDRRRRCWWCLDAPEYIDYHDRVWGRPMHDDSELFEMFVLESFQSGLSWLTILRKREGFRSAFDCWDVAKIAEYGDREVARLLGDPGIVRNRAKIEATIANAAATRALRAQGETLDALLWRFAPDRGGPPPTSGQTSPRRRRSRRRLPRSSSGWASASSAPPPRTRLCRRPAWSTTTSPAASSARAALRRPRIDERGPRGARSRARTRGRCYPIP